MTCINRLFVCFISLVHVIVTSKIIHSDEKTARKFLEILNKESTEVTSKLVVAQWKFETQNSENAKQELFQVTSEAIKNAKRSFHTVLTNYPWTSYSNPDIRRQLKLYSEIGILALPDEKYQEFQQIMSELEVIQQNTTVCDYFNRTKCDLRLHPDVQKKLEVSLNLREILYLRSEWKRLTEPKLKKLWNKYVDLSNLAAVFNNYKNFKEYSLRNIDINDPKQEMENLWDYVKPLYEQIHAYVRRKLRNIYGEKTVPKKGVIPAELLGDVWCENWAGIAHKLLPFPEEDNINFTEIMTNLSYTPKSVRNLAENYYVSMNFTVPFNLWYNETSKNHFGEVCRPRIFNFYNNDIRIKDCGRISLKDYLEDIRLLAKAEYMLLYSHQPFIYQTPADPGLEFAVSDLLTLSASTLNNLKRVGLYNKEVTYQSRINRLFKIALEKITAMPLLIAQEFWRWDIFNGKSVNALTGLNELREKFQGISSVTKDLGFNPGGMSSAFSKISLVHQFFGYFLEFQMYESFCPKSESPFIDECSFFEKIEVRDTLRYIMSMGASKSLKEVKEILLGAGKITPKSILNYFEPLMNWLKTENRKTGEFIGWNLPGRREENLASKPRRKRSLHYSTEEKKDSDKSSSKEPDRFQRLIYKRSEIQSDENKESQNELKGFRNVQESNWEKAKDTLTDQQKQRRSSDENERKSNYKKRRRSMTESNEIHNPQESMMEGENKGSNAFLPNEYTLRNLTHNLDSEIFDKFDDRSNNYNEIVGKGSGRVLNSYRPRTLKHHSDLGSFDEIYGDLNSFSGFREEGDNRGGSFLTSNHKKRYSDSFDKSREISYRRSVGKEKNPQSLQKHASRNTKRFSKLKSAVQPSGSSYIYSKTGSSTNSKRHSDPDTFDVSHQDSKTFTKTIEEENEDSQMPDKRHADGPQKIRRRSDSKNSHANNYNSRFYGTSVENENKGRTSNKYTSGKAKLQKNFDSLDHSNIVIETHTKSLGNKEKVPYQKRKESETNESDDDFESEDNADINTAKSTGINKVRYERRIRKKQKRYTNKESKSQNRQTRSRKNQNQGQNERLSRNAQWHTNTKKDISRLLHSIGFAVESDEKDKVKEVKKKLKGDSNSDLKGTIVSKENSYENIIDFNRMKSGVGKSDPEEEKGANKYWAVKTYLADGAKMMQSPSDSHKKDVTLDSHFSSSLVSKALDEKSVGKKDTSVNGESGLVLIDANQKINGNGERQFSQSGESNGRLAGIDELSLQAILQGNYGQKQMYSIKSGLAENKVRDEMSQTNQQIQRANENAHQLSNGFMYKYVPGSDAFQYKDKKDSIEAPDAGNNNLPYIIIVGQLTPEMKEKLLEGKETSFVNVEKQPLFQAASSLNEKKLSDKRSRESDQIYVVPIDVKSSQLNHMKPNLYAGQERDAGHESADEGLRLEDDSRLEEKNNFYRAGKESPSEYILSWDNDKNRKIVKRSKREHAEHKKKVGENNMKLLRLTPMKDSLIEGLLGKSLNPAGPDDKSRQVLIRDGYLNSNSEYVSSANAESSGSLGRHVEDQSHTVSLQPASSLSSLASSVISALSAKGYSQVSTASGQHQDSELDEDSPRETGGAQALGKEHKEQELPYFLNSRFKTNNLMGKKKSAKLYSDDETRKLIDFDPAAKGDYAVCKKVILTSSPPKCPCPGPGPCPCPCPCPLPCPLPYPSPGPPDDCKTPSLPPPPCPCPSPCPAPCPSPCPAPCPAPCPEMGCKKPSECSLVNCQFKITKAKKPHERLTIMIYDRINPPAELPEPYDALAVISEILQRIQCCSSKPCQLTEEDPDYPANDNMDQLKGSENAGQDSKSKVQELSGEIPIVGESSEEDEPDDGALNAPQGAGPSNEDKYQPREKATPAIDQLTVFNKDKLKPVFIELRKIDDVIKKRNQQE